MSTSCGDSGFSPSHPGAASHLTLTEIAAIMATDDYGRGLRALDRLLRGLERWAASKGSVRRLRWVLSSPVSPAGDLLALIAAMRAALDARGSRGMPLLPAAQAMAAALDDRIGTPPRPGATPEVHVRAVDDRAWAHLTDPRARHRRRDVSAIASPRAARVHGLLAAPRAPGVIGAARV
ncbi:hypothetical protein ACLQ2Q_22115 [Microbacterium sp. DT81.1]|uniref:hypothetical protein n=1 Tax=Microbacterium sp. DT81.1 TaxID=3393413 RepID=UPI003CF76701